MKQTKGITLITLIITIVVMLILVAVSVRVVKNSDLIGVAKQTGKLTEEAKEKEQSGKVEIDGVEYDSIEDYKEQLYKRRKYGTRSRFISNRNNNFNKKLGRIKRSRRSSSNRWKTRKYITF